MKIRGSSNNLKFCTIIAQLSPLQVLLGPVVGWLQLALHVPLLLLSSVYMIRVYIEYI